MSVPSFIVRVSPGRTLQDTKFSAYGEFNTDPKYIQYYYSYAIAYIKDRHPDLYNKYIKNAYSQFGVVGRLQGEKYVLKNDEYKASVSLTPEGLRHALWNNSESDSPTHFSTSLNDSITTSSSIGWSESVTAGVTFTVGIEVGEGPVKTNASTSYSLSTTVGKNEEKSKSIGVGSTDEVSKDVPGGEIDIAVLFVERGEVFTELEFGREFTGSVSCSFWTKPYKHKKPSPGGHCVYPDLVKTMEISGKELSKYAPFEIVTAKVSIGFAGNSTTQIITVSDTDPDTIDEAINSAKSELYAP